jgi:hypothetical protein
VEEHEAYQDAKAGNGEQRRAYDVDFTMSLRELFHTSCDKFLFVHSVAAN